MNSKHESPLDVAHTPRLAGWVHAARMLLTRSTAVALFVTAAVATTTASADAPPATDRSGQVPAAHSDAAATAEDAAAGAGTNAPHQGSPSRYAPDRFAGRAGVYYRQFWGVDTLSVRLVQSGELVRFSYRVLDPQRARVLNDKQTEARLEAPRAGVSLSVPTMEKVGQLRQTAAPEPGRSYWMTFSNKGRRVVRGDRVDVVIGQFRANNLIVD